MAGMVNRVSMANPQHTAPPLQLLAYLTAELCHQFHTEHDLALCEHYCNDAGLRNFVHAHPLHAHQLIETWLNAAKATPERRQFALRFFERHLFPADTYHRVAGAAGHFWGSLPFAKNIARDQALRDAMPPTPPPFKPAFVRHGTIPAIKVVGVAAADEGWRKIDRLKGHIRHVKREFSKPKQPLPEV